ncbi:hypothetical protein R1sor_005368 [Riccia sorocarpa]|uniref:Pentatricopeptide repeat-containing protein n=1 Tax=Riccia sorocarpa TaxID=122646 RepID=A0ABD3HMB7_9MARC
MFAVMLLHLQYTRRSEAAYLSIEFINLREDEIFTAMNSLKRRFTLEDLRILELRCRLSSEFRNHVPFLAAAMDTVLKFRGSFRAFSEFSHATTSRCQTASGFSEIRNLSTSRDAEQYTPEAVGRSQERLRYSDVEVEEQEIQSTHYRRRSHRNRPTRAWPWISVIPPGEPVNSAENNEQQQQKQTMIPAPSNPPRVPFPDVYHHPVTKKPIQVLPLNVPEKICTILNQYGWSAHTKIELRALVKEIGHLKPRQIQVVLREQRHAEVAYGFLHWAMAEANCKVDIKSFTIVMTLLGRVRKFHLLEQLLVDLEEKGYTLDRIIYTAAIRSYASGFKLQEAMSLFAKMKERGFKGDCVTYSVVISMCSRAKLYQEAIKLYEEMLNLGIATDTQLYNCVICMFGKAGRLDLAYQKLGEMRERGHIPDQYTYGVLIEGYAKAGRREFLDLYKEMQNEGIPLNEVIFNILFLGISRLGTLQDAERVYADMEQVGLAANLNAFATLISMCSRSGRASEAQKWFDKMCSLGLQPTIAIANSLLDGYSRAKQFIEANKVLESYPSWGLVPNLQTFTVCIRCLTLFERKEDGELVQRMLACHEASEFLKALLDSSTPEKNLPLIISGFFSSLHSEKRQARRDFVDALINYLYRFGFRAQGNQVWEEALASYIFPSLVEQGPEGICSVNLQNMEYGTAVVALTRTFPRLIKQFHRTEMTPEWVQIITGPLRKEPEVDVNLVHQAVSVLLKSLNSPFRVNTLETFSGLVGRGEDVTNWLDEPQVKAMLALKHIHVG